MKYYSGVGSRNTPDNICKVMENLAFALSQDAWVLRSGGADGADMAFQKGATNSFSEVVPEIYIPWKGFNGLEHNPSEGIIGVHNSSLREKAYSIASEIHPAWDKCSSGAKTLHLRNVFQVLGKDLETPSKFLVCWAKPTKDGVSGGTNTALKLAKMHNIPCFNLYFEEVIERISKFIN